MNKCFKGWEREKMGKVDYYRLRDIVYEKEPEVFKYEVETDGTRQYIPGKWLNMPRELTRDARSADRVFCRIAVGKDTPERPCGGGNEGFYFNTGRLMAFRGTCGKDLAMYWHMIVIPNLDIVQESQLQWVFSLNRGHIPLLMEMKAHAMVFLAENKDAFIAKYGQAPISKAMRSQLQFGFHTMPGAAYLHMHVLLGPLTAYGGSDALRGWWIHLDEVIEILMIEGSMSHYQYSPGHPLSCTSSSLACNKVSTSTSCLNDGSEDGACI